MKKIKTQLTIGERIRAARLAKSRRVHATLPELARGKITLNEAYTQAELAADSGCQQGQISEYECGHIEPSLPVIRRLAAALDCSIGELIGD
jgi:transcriptional regulator with XRE-family HTH domain